MTTYLTETEPRPPIEDDVACPCSGCERLAALCVNLE
jgi:hypothetical protein